jgi:hypothetical protein
MTDVVKRALDDPGVSAWLKQALWQALAQDPVEVARDAEVLRGLLNHRAQAMLKGIASPSPRRGESS